MTYRIDSAAGMLFVTGEGVIDQSERLAAVKAMLSDPAYHPGLPTLADFSAASSAPSLIELQYLVGVVQRNAAAIGQKKMAIVTALPATFGAARQFQALMSAGPFEVHVFHARDEALAWLGGTYNSKTGG